MQERLALACSRGNRQLELIREVMEEGSAIIQMDFGHPYYGYAKVSEKSFYGLRDRLEIAGFNVSEDWDSMSLTVSFCRS